jgi:hypothetical protein
MKKTMLFLILVIGLQFSNGQCPPITQFEYSNYTGSSVELSWQENGTATIWQIEYGVSPYSQGAGGVSLISASNPLTITGLVPGVLYDFYISSQCANQFSTSVGPLLVPGNHNVITGNLTYDPDLNGCNMADPRASGVLVSATDTTTGNEFTGRTDSNGEYTIYVPDDTYNLSTSFSNSNLSVSPLLQTFMFPNATSSAVQDFCIAPIVLQEDIEVRLIPLNQARPGFDVMYIVTVTNQGTLPVTDVLDFIFPSDYVTFLTSTPTSSSWTSSTLSWNYSLDPFESVTYELNFNSNPPTHPTFPLNSGDLLSFTASTYLNGTDVDLTNNSFDLDQVVVNSYDPNDIKCLQGNSIEPNRIGEYLDYLIRFENTGTASAINVRIKDVIDTFKFDIDSFIPLNSSHEYYTSITNGNEVEFHFDDINLDFNDATNDGYVLFKIRTLNTLIDGDSFDTTAEIYFDFNFPIVTNTETVTILNTASVADTADSSIYLFPNPSRDFINVSSSYVIKSIAILDMQGRIQSQHDASETDFEQGISIEKLKQGMYFVIVQSEQGQKNLKLMVN